MSQPSSFNPAGVEAPKQKQKISVYTVMLFISFCAIVLACMLLWMELQLWGDYPWWKTTEAETQGAFNYMELIQRTTNVA
ncbi:MAG: hypothetical protein H6821_12600 [Planctomycetaceae bacterium]|nr:hypothetical protein [Planctomycetales bacterium]MCB9875009.1 hypothetical protein [Planctomycetaceae bacterium]HRX82059.1 hypothetical protein [Pirellulaceae bacterium]